MTDSEYNFILEDRIAKIQAINNEYDLEHNGYISFSGGKDSCVVSRLIDIAIPNNKIPRIYFNTGIEYLAMTKFVKSICEKDKRFIMINSNVNIRKMLRENGYPFKSKKHSHNWSLYSNNASEELDSIIKYLTDNPDMQKDYEYIHNLPNGYKTTIKYIFGIREREREVASAINTLTCPEKLKYQFTKDFIKNGFKLSDKCCYKMKKEIAHKYEKETGKNIAITGMRASEGGMRSMAGCTIFDGDKLTKFHPLKVIDDDFENEFIKRENIELCSLYYPPYNFKRTGCIACPYAIELEEVLNKFRVLLPSEYKRAYSLWKPVYDEYVRLGYRLSKDFYKGVQLSLFDEIK